MTTEIDKGMNMKQQYSTQYETAAIVPSDPFSPDDLMDECRRVGAIYYEDGLDDECFVVVLRPDIGPELWTESALRRAAEQAAKKKGKT